MFGKRQDGTLIRDLDPISKATPYFMAKRYDALNMFEEKIDVAAMDAYLKREAEKGNSLTYMHVIMAAFVRGFALRPRMNRFISNCKFYQRKDITFSLVVKKSLTDDGEECLVKMHFTGSENIYDVKKIIDDAIEANLKQTSGNGTEVGAKVLGAMPGFMFKFGLGLIKLIDRWNMMPKSFYEWSPFHTGVFFTNMRSIKNDAIFHHIYNFGTCSLFIAIGKEKMTPVVNDDGEIVSVKTMKLGITLDERICDGFYMVKSMRLLKRLLQDPDILNDRLELPPKPTKKELKAQKKEKKKEVKRQKKEKK